MNIAEKLKGAVQIGVRSEENKHLIFHWEKIRPDVAKEVEIAKDASVAVKQ